MGLGKDVIRKERRIICSGDVQNALLVIKDRIRKQTHEKGNLCFLSLGEIRGYLDEEVDEFHDEQRRNDVERAADELIDIAVSAIWGLASIYRWQA